MAKRLYEKRIPRYQYQRRRWERAGKTNIPLAMQIDALVQGLANATFLALPAFIIGANTNPTFSTVEIVGLVLWGMAFAFESIADTQKIRFLRKMSGLGEKRKVCDVGLWQYSRHPNYFGEWMVWNALVLASVPSWLGLAEREPLVIWLALGLKATFCFSLDVPFLGLFNGGCPLRILLPSKTPGLQSLYRTGEYVFWEAKTPLARAPLGEVSSFYYFSY